jgi:hypothetical protein
MFSYTHEKHSEEQLLEFKNQIKRACSAGEEDVGQYLAIVDKLKAVPTLSARAMRTLTKLIGCDCC